MASKIRVKVRFWHEGYSPEVVIEDPMEAFAADIDLEVNTGSGWRAAKPGFDPRDIHDWLTDEGYTRQDPVLRDRRNGTGRAWEGLYEFSYVRRVA